MKNAKIVIRPTDIRSLVYNNNFSGKAGEHMKLDVKNGVMIKLNPETPTNAFVFIKFEAIGSDNTVQFVMETVTAVSASTFIDNLDEVIKKDYLPSIMLAVNEKIRNAASIVGLNISVPPISFKYGDQENGSDEGIDNIINFSGKN